MSLCQNAIIPEKETANELNVQRGKNRQLERELQRKEKALAEASAERCP